MLCLKIAGRVANSVDTDETRHSWASHLGLQCLLRPFFPNTYSKHDSSVFFPLLRQIAMSGKNPQHMIL